MASKYLKKQTKKLKSPHEEQTIRRNEQIYNVKILTNLFITNETNRFKCWENRM